MEEEARDHASPLLSKGGFDVDCSTERILSPVWHLNLFKFYVCSTLDVDRAQFLYPKDFLAN